MTENPTTKSWGRRLAGNIALAGAALLASLVVCEVLLRLLGVSYPVFVWTDRVRPVSSLRMFTVAAATTALLGSVTVPRIEAVNRCAKAGAAAKRRRRDATKHCNCLRMDQPPRSIS